MNVLKAILAKLINGIFYGLAFVVMGLALIVVAIIRPIDTARAIKAAVWD